MTKMFEETVEDSVTKLMERWREHKPLGEITLLVGGHPRENAPVDIETALAQVHDILRREDLPKREACRRVASRLGIPARDLYQRLIQPVKAPPLRDGHE